MKATPKMPAPRLQPLEIVAVESDSPRQPLFEIPYELENPPAEPSDLEELDWPDTDDDRWDAFIPDDDERDPMPEPGDFWIDCDRGAGREAA